jgi:hypothetical protein
MPRQSGSLVRQIHGHEQRTADGRALFREECRPPLWDPQARQTRMYRCQSALPQPVIHCCPRSSDCCPRSLGILSAMPRNPHVERRGGSSPLSRRVIWHPVPIERRTVMAPSRDAVDEKVTAAVGVDTRSITSSCYRVYLAEFRRKSRPTMGVLPGLACASILNTNSSCPSWVSWLIR